MYKISEKLQDSLKINSDRKMHTEHSACVLKKLREEQIKSDEYQVYINLTLYRKLYEK